MPAAAASPLQDKALKDAQVRVKSLLKGAITVEPVDNDTVWHERDLREIYEQQMILWFAYGDFDVFLDANNKPIGFFDKTKLVNCVYKEMPHATILQMAAATGFVSPSGRILSAAKGPAECLQAVVVNDATAVDAPRLVVRINPKLQRIISIAPEGVTP